MLESKTREQAPQSVRIRMYEVGHGDCFLLRFRYPEQRDRHVLIDCGTTAADWREQNRRLRIVANDIRTECRGKLDIVVATHPHRDHVGGFARTKSNRAPGTILDGLRPECVLLPWTEDPRRAYSRCYARAAASLARAWKAFPIQAAIPNQRAVESLKNLGRVRKYLHAGMDSGLERLLPGVQLHVLGPAKESKTTKGFWRTAMFEPRPKGKLFPKAPQWEPRLAPPPTRWFIDRLAQLQQEQLIALAQSLNEAVNNTSLILLFQFGEHSLLFPGDAELSAWQVALENPFVRKQVEKVTVYKAAHHGKSNGTPKELAQLLSQPLVLLSARKVESGMADYANLIGTPALRAAQRMFTDVELFRNGTYAELGKAA